jgi:hypothetical protein
MAEGRLRSDWDVASNIMATIWNAAPNFSGKKREIIHPWQCNPYRQNGKTVEQKVPGDISCLKRLLPE